ncbi:ThuA domain-containing protein [Prevotella sp. 10(H)]|uniref:ThuA domain-containing protein n=1 Tax=Prevotella sp. 10(H) TaxID=1158294 RepID=UPI000AE41341|nr:ThuA domain-containing protein [Prevotella sp. 10(H)]
MKIFAHRKFLLFVFSFFIALSTFATAPIKALIITGQNNHNWQVSHVVLKNIMENSGLFTVDFSISPKHGEKMNNYIIDFSPYQLVVLDYNGDNWPKTTQDRFLEYVRNGGGVVVYHAANNAFTDWVEFNKIIALGGWNNRNESSGPWVYWKDNKLVRDNSPGVGGSHGQQSEYVLNARNTKHPIVKGLPPKWKHGKDELYDRMRGPGDIKDLLYTAYSEPSLGGSDREEPLIFTVEYGKGKIFHIMLGHAGDSPENNPSMQCTGFQVLLLRGSEWAGNRQSYTTCSKRFSNSYIRKFQKRL